MAAALAVGDGPRTILHASASPSIVPESLQMAPRGELKRRGRVSPVGWDNNRGEDGELGLDTKAFFAGENAGLQQPGGPSLPFKSPTRLGYQRFSQFYYRFYSPFGFPSNRLKTSFFGFLCRVTRLNDHGRLQATWCLSAESRSAARRPSAPSAPLRAHEDRLGRFGATRKSVGMAADTAIPLRVM